MTAFSVNVNAATFVVDTTSDTQDAAPGNGICADAGGLCSLRAAISESNALAGPDIITLPAGTYTQSLAGANEDINAGGDFDIRSSVTINGAGAATTIVQSNAAFDTATERVFHVFSATVITVLIDGVTVRNGVAPVSQDGGRGAGIKVGNNAATDSNITFTLTNSSVLNNHAGTRGGGFAVNKANSTISNCTFDGNIAGGADGTSGAGGAILVDSEDNVSIPAMTSLITNTVMTNNQAASSVANTFGGAVIVRAIDATVTMDHVTANNNISNASGSGFSAFAGGLYNQQAHMIVTNSTVDSNVTSLFHAGIRNLASTGGAATLDITNTSISNNSSTDYDIGGTGWRYH